MGIPLVTAWETLLEDETDPQVKAFLQKLDDNWKNLPLDMPIRVAPTIQSEFPPAILPIFYPLSWSGEAMGMLDATWLGAVAICLLRDRLEAGGECSIADALLFASFKDLFMGEQLTELKYEEWSSSAIWGDHDIEPMSMNEVLPLWFASNRKHDPLYDVSSAVRNKILESGEASGMREHAGKIIEDMRNALMCL